MMMLTLMWLMLGLQPTMASSSNRQAWGNPNGCEDVRSAEVSGRKGLHMRLRNLQKAWAYLDSMSEEGKPVIIAATETHLKDLHLNRAWRRATSLGWHTFATRAVSSQTSVLDGTSSTAEVPTMFANHGGQALLVQPHVHATGYHQDEGAVGYRSIIVKHETDQLTHYSRLL